MIISLHKKIVAEISDDIGDPMLFKIITVVQDESQHCLPVDDCCICMTALDEQFVRTACVHYYHAACLSAYVFTCRNIPFEVLEYKYCQCIGDGSRKAMQMNISEFAGSTRRKGSGRA